MPGSCVGRLILERRTQPFFRPFSEPPAVRDGGLRGVPRDNIARVGVTNMHLNSVHAPEYMLAPMSSVRGSIDPSVLWLQSQRARSETTKQMSTATARGVSKQDTYRFR